MPFLGEHADLDISSKMAWLVRIGRVALLFAADSCNIEPRLYEHLHREIGDVDVLFLGMECDGAPLSWIYGPLLTQRLDRSMDESRRLAGSGYEQGNSIAEIFHCEEVYVYAMGQEPWLNYIVSIKYTDESYPKENGGIGATAVGMQDVISPLLSAGPSYRPSTRLL